MILNKEWRKEAINIKYDLKSNYKTLFFTNRFFLPGHGLIPYISINIHSLSSQTVYKLWLWWSKLVYRPKINHSHDESRGGIGIIHRSWNWSSMKWLKRCWEVTEFVSGYTWNNCIFLSRNIFGRKYMGGRECRCWAAVSMDSNRYVLLFGNQASNLPFLIVLQFPFKQLPWLFTLSWLKSVTLLYSKQKSRYILT